ncbi:serine--tRNA ligase [bacterium]|nr:serine--tRNA ligase [bacterium]
MLDIKFIVENQMLVKQGAAKKNIKIDLDKIVSLDSERKKILLDVEALRTRQNSVSKDVPKKSGDEKQELLDEMKKLKDNLKIQEQALEDIQEELDTLVLYVPNPPFDEVPEGKGEEDNVVIEKFMEPTKFDFEPKDHIELGKSLDLLELDKAAEMSGARFYYVKNDLVLLEFALIQYALSKIIPKGFSPILPPALVHEKAMIGTGFFPADKNEIYSVNPGEDDLYLIGTAEVPLCMLHYDEIIDEKKLPLRYVGFSPCFRREAGSYGKDTAGIIRVHQFDKIEMFIFAHPDKAKEEHQLIVKIEDEIVQGLKIPYQRINICGGDLGAPAAQKFDIEAWIPTQGKYREITSCSNTTDFQARRSKIRFKDSKGNKKHVYTLNGTAIAMARMFVAILENYQNKDGSVTIPEVLRPYMGGKEKIEAK